VVEQDHRRVKQRIRPMLGFKRINNAIVTISGIELAAKIKKGSSRWATRWMQRDDDRTVERALAA